MAPMRTVREGRQSVRTETKGGNLPQKKKQRRYYETKAPWTSSRHCKKWLWADSFTCVWGERGGGESPYRTAAAGVELRTPETWAFPDVRLKPLRTAASRTYTAAECPAWRWNTLGSRLPPRSLRTLCTWGGGRGGEHRLWRQPAQSFTTTQ